MSTPGSEPKNFSEIQQRLDDIVSQVRSKDLSLEKSLDLYEEAIRLSNAALESIGSSEFSEEEQNLYDSEKLKSAPAAETSEVE